jgi:hypothetical protein
MGGLVTLAKPESLPDGASPRTYNTDFRVGSVKTCPGLTSVYSYAGSGAGPSPGSHAVDTSLGGAAWTNPGNVLLNTGVYATASLPAAVSVIDTITEVTYVAATNALEVQFNSPVPAGLFAYTFSGLSGFTLLNGQTLTAVSVFATSANFIFPGGGSVDVGPRRDSGQASIATLVPFSDAIDVTTFGFSVPGTSGILGFQVAITGYASTSCDVNAQMLKNGSPVGLVRSIALNISTPTIVDLGGANDLFGSAWSSADVNSTSFGVRLTASSSNTVVASLGYTTIKVFVSPSLSNFNFICTFTDQDGTVRNLSEDANGNLWVENVTSAPGQLALAIEGLTPNSYMTSAEGEGVEYLTFNNGFHGSDQPRQYTAQWTDRITQVGPGVAPVFTPVAASSTTFAIATITQPAQMSDPADPGHFQTIQWSQGPTSTAAGNVVTIFYANANSYPEDPVLSGAFNSGQTVYVYMSSLPSPYVNGTYQVTSVGKAVPPGGSAPRWYFTFQMTTSTYNQIGGPDTGTGFYQQTLATMTMSVAVPGLEVGNQVTISGTSVSNYNTSWPISQTVNSGAMAITQTQVTSGTATYSYSLSSGVAPVAGQPVTITGTTNANGGLNLVNATIVTATGGSTGSFTVAVSLPNAAAEAEQGQATTAGTIFTFDPGLTTLGSMTSPIYGPSTGGTITFAGSGQFVGSGTRQGTVFFITRNGYYTAPAPPVTFTCPSNTAAIAAALIPIGPPNVIKRGIAFTEPGQNGVPGANFFNIPTDVKYTVNNVQYTANSLIINDNTTTSATFFFTDQILLSSRAVDIYGFNLFNQIELGNPGWVVNYDSRNFYGLCQNKIQNFNNLSFDGGFLVATNPLPLGWTAPDQYGSLLASPIFGNSYYIRNSSGSLLSTAGLISQTAYQDAYGVPIIQPNTAYSVRVTARIPSGITAGNLVISLTSSGAVLGSFTLPFASMTTAMAIYSGTLLTAVLPSTPAALLLNISATGMANGADVEIDRIDPFPTAIPNLGTTVYGSYSGLSEQVDGITGQGKFTSENQQPVNGAVVMYDTFYGLKGQGPNASMYSWQASPNLEPADWTEPEVAQRAGACGPMAFDFGEQWLVEACRNGIYLFEGGQPGKIMQEIYQVWDALNWQAAETIWLKNDVTQRRLFVGVPMPTPNFWLPNAPADAAPTSPNVILMCNYQGLDSGEALKSSPQMHTTMFGTLNAIDMRRKWSLWTIAAPYGSFVQTATDKAFYLCNGENNSKVYMLDENNETFDGTEIDSLYTTAGLPNDAKRKELPALGDGNVRIGYMNMTCDITGNLQVRFLPNILLGPNDSTLGYNPWTVPGGFNGTGKSLWNRKASVNFFAVRSFVEFRGPHFDLSSLTLTAVKDVWSSPWGQK